MPRTWKRKTERGVSEELLKGALEQVARGKTIRSTAKTFGICHVTLSRYVKTKRQLGEQGSSESPKVGYFAGKTVFTEDQEAKVAEILQEAAGRKSGLTPSEVKRFAFQLAVQYQRKRPSSWDRMSMAGADWFSAFIKRNPTLSIRKHADDPSPETCTQGMMVPPQYAAAHAIPPHALTQLARDWLAEDTPNFDPAGVCVGSAELEARLFCKTPNSVLAGSPFFTAVFAEVGCTVNWLYQDADELGSEGITLVAEVRGPARCLLLGERPALNCLARASGIATRCSELQRMAAEAGWCGEVAGTRKTTPGFRLVEKYAMLVGGASMHRQDLSGMVMLKDNHVWASGSIPKAVLAARSVCGFSSKIEVECSSIEEASEAARAGADIIMLDNLKPQELHASALALKEEFPTLLVEASGGVTPENLPQYFGPHVDIISLGCITQGCPVVDFSLKVQRPLPPPASSFTEDGPE
ncbi:hypothetical protein NHX12_017662 [Muraenolepis orangiensis]|uniref:Nicotinate-nucleotide pyrophosphorylase [carboxylating] n=1 Tax=Muraenolepis orangiensis TaxID=630683 RepID=A0A9Q0EVC1_9TELE|nr:hypothetical protein NHX12_017662 [Muraenolepis orangiensis]